MEHTKHMKYRYFAPLEGITTYIFRNAFNRYYGGIDKYFAPFMSPAEPYLMTPREYENLAPSHNEEIFLVPQIITNSGKLFNEAARDLMGLGYSEINLNLGCPSGIVCSKKKGAGALRDLYHLEKMLDEIFDEANKFGTKISVKSRIGWSDSDEWADILEVYNEFPIYELIVHPRVRESFYKGEVDIMAVELALSESRNPVVYNGDLFDISDILRTEADERVSGVMMGRGFLKNPELLTTHVSEDRMRIFGQFHDEIMNGYIELLGSEAKALFPMKELWTYWKCMFPHEEADVKEILKSKSMEDYFCKVNSLIEKNI